MLIYFGETVTVKVQGETWREEKCRHCGCVFHYPVRVVATGAAANPYFLNSYGSSRQAEETARDQLDDGLKNAVLPVPCPHCSKYQEYMVPVLRAARHLWIRSAVQFLFAAGIIVLVLTLSLTVVIIVPAKKSGLNWPAVAVLLSAPVLPLGACLSLFILRRRLQAAYDPNAEEYTPERCRLAAGYALAPEAFARLQIPTSPPGVTRLGPPPRQGQLVGLKCVRCGGKIPDELDSRFCSGCGWPVHTRCAVPADGGCTRCGAGAAGA